MSAIAEWICAATQRRIGEEDAATYAELFVDSGFDRVELLAGAAESFDEEISDRIESVIHRRLLKFAVGSLAEAAAPTAAAPRLMAAVVRPVAIVTGGTRGIGKGISEALADGGYDLLLTYGSNKEAATAHAEQLRAGGTKVALSGGDVAKDETIVKYFEVLATEFPGQKLSAVVHNAGQYVGRTADNDAGITDGTPRILGSLLGPDGEVDLSFMEYYHNIYAKAWVRIVERSVPLMEEGGSIVGISSPGCNATQQPVSAYDMSGSAKTVMETTARYYAKNLASRGITVNVVIPGITSSDAWKALGKGKGKGGDRMSVTVAAAVCPMGRAASCRELGNVVSFLCSPGARYITGVALPVDGGLHLGRTPPPPDARGKGEGIGKGDENAEGKGDEK